MAHAQPFSMAQFGLRFLFALVLVFVSYNPSGYSFAHWLKLTFPAITPLLAVCASALLIGWGIYLRATFRSLGVVGLLLASVFFGCLIWLFVDLGWLSLVNVSVFSWVVLLVLALMLAFGISWSHIRRRMTGQVDMDDVDN
ncbi:DUF6524 family protein [Teredinibacter franksiae]|jgi:hypothetical protein|uniref:DUF6524 family protein n=1 Tax=Teredinibacter franksiae TaxID=2761453 RepID=UPI001628DF46|nr:DUF6524 family protein [Teredinibacter franksiae]